MSLGCRTKALAAVCCAVLAPVGAAAQDPPFAPPDPAARVVFADGAWKVVDAACPALPADTGLRQRIVDVAAEEWARFGYQVEEIQQTGLSVVARPERGSIIPRSLNRVRPGITRRVLRLGRMEDSQRIAPAIGGYWAATPDSAGIDIQNRLLKGFEDNGWAVAWSAAFVSYVMCASGIADLDQFARNEGHWVYVDQAIAAADGTAPRAIYRARDPDLGLPKAGDLVCLDRGGNGLESVDDKRRKPGEMPLHCDIVVKVDRKGGMVAMIGGNVVQSVTMSLVNIQPAGHGKPARLQRDTDIKGGRGAFAVLELTTGGEAALDKAPAIRRIAQP